VDRSPAQIPGLRIRLVKKWPCSLKRVRSVEQDSATLLRTLTFCSVTDRRAVMGSAVEAETGRLY
jgi:hypothetical protein